MDSINRLNDESLKVRQIMRGFRPPFHYIDFCEYYHKCGFRRCDVCVLTEKSESTVKRWEKTDAPFTVYLLLYACAGFVLSDSFAGFRFTDNLLYTGTRITYNYGFTANDIMEYSFFKDYTRTLKQENEELNQRLRDFALVGFERLEQDR